MKHETTFEDGREITPYLSTAVAEGFCEGENASRNDILSAWSYLIGTRLCFSLQGWFRRQAVDIIKSGVINDDGIVNWPEID